MLLPVPTNLQRNSQLLLPPMNQFLSPKQVAEALGTSESSVKRWCDQGVLSSVKTAGGHRRIPVQEALRFAREQNHEVIEPRILALPCTQDRKARRIDGCAERLTEALLASNEVACRSIIFELFVAGHPVSQIFDEVFATAFRTIGQKWECHEAEVYQERCSCEIALRVIHDLRRKQMPPDESRMALGAAPEGDLYSLPLAMSEVVLRSVGWDARLLGSSIPFDSMIAALRKHRPGIFWLSVSHIEDEAEFIAGFNRLFESASQQGTAIVVGGRALTPLIRPRLRYCAYCDTMAHLEQFAKTLLRPAEVTPAGTPVLERLKSRPSG